MDGKIDVRKAAITLGVVFVVWHLSWILLTVIFGSGFVNWIANLHFLSVAYATAAFDLVTLLVGLVGAFVTGALTGAVFAYVWNLL